MLAHVVPQDIFGDDDRPVEAAQKIGRRRGRQHQQQRQRYRNASALVVKPVHQSEKAQRRFVAHACHPSLSPFCRMVSLIGVPSRPKVERI